MKNTQKIVLVVNFLERDERINQKIQTVICEINPHAEVRIIERCGAEMMSKILEFRPDVIMACPLTAAGMSLPFYILKFLLNCILVCFRTEGVLNINSAGQIEEMAGLDSYGNNLVDYEVFWGSRTAEAVGRHLIEQGKISSQERIIHLGMPYFEDYLRPHSDQNDNIPTHIRKKLDQYKRKEIILSVTGFHLADYSPQDILVAGDLVKQTSENVRKEFDKVSITVQKIYKFRKMWIDTFVSCALNHPEMLFVIKTHPMETINYRERNINPYKVFEGYDNILLISETIPIQAILSRCGILLHYGSTTMIEAYLSRVPTVYVNAKVLGLGSSKLYELDDIGIPSTLSVDINDVPSIVQRYARDLIRFQSFEAVEKYLEDVLDIKVGEEYRPSERIARFLLSIASYAPRSISSDDQYLVKAIQQIGQGVIYDLINKGVSKVKGNDFHAALTYLDNALTLVKIGRFKIEKLQYVRSFCLLHMGRTDEAIVAAKAELAINPGSQEARDLLNHLQSMSSRTDPAGHTRSPGWLNQLRPKVFMVETVLGCDLKCPECAVGGNIITRKKGRMTFEQFKIIADKIRPFCNYLYLHIWGEPLLSRDIYKIIKYASDFTKTNISTNANHLREEDAERLILSGVTDLIVSIDGVTLEVYEAYRKGGSAEKALRSLKLLQEINIRNGNKVSISPQYIVFKHNQHEMDIFAKFCEWLDLKPSFKDPYIHEGSTYEYAQNPDYIRSGYPDIPSLSQAMRQCNDPKEVFTILLDGTCVMCCYDHNGGTNYGNIFKHDVLDIWNSPRYRKDRWGIITGDPPRYCIENCLQWRLQSSSKKEMNAGSGNNSISNADSISINRSSDITNTFSGKIGSRSSTVRQYGRRLPFSFDLSDANRALEYARACFREGDFDKAIDIYEKLSLSFPAQSVEILAELYDQYQILADEDRYSLYQSRCFDFGIRPNDKVLDMGSGNIPFRYATHLADIAVNDNSYGRAGQPFKHVDGKPVYECSIEDMQFENNEFDFVYCSHVLEHVENPERACEELMRIGKRGFIETPTRGKDIWLNTAKISHHRWFVEKVNNGLIFTEYSLQEINGFQNSILMGMHVSPETPREKAFSALIYLKAELVNTMLLWENSFKYEVRRLNS